MTDADLDSLRLQLLNAKGLEDQEWAAYEAAKTKWLLAHNAAEELKDKIAAEEARRRAVADYLSEQRNVGAAAVPTTPVPS